MTLPEGRPGKLLALGILGLLLALAYVAVLAPLEALHASRAQEIAQLRERLAHLRRAVAELPQLRATLSEVRTRSAPDDLLLPGASEAVAAANLQSKVKDLFAETGTELISAEGLPAAAQGGQRRVGIRVLVAAELNVLANVLHALGAARPFLFVDNIEVHSNPAARLQAADKSAVLNIALNVYGYRANGT